MVKSPVKYLPSSTLHTACPLTCIVRVFVVLSYLTCSAIVIGMFVIRQDKPSGFG